MTTPAADTPPRPNSPLASEAADTTDRAKAAARRRSRTMPTAGPTSRYSLRSNGLATMYATVIVLAVVTAMAHGLAVEGASLALVLGTRLVARRRLARQAQHARERASSRVW